MVLDFFVKRHVIIQLLLLVGIADRLNHQTIEDANDDEFEHMERAMQEAAASKASAKRENARVAKRPAASTSGSTPKKAKSASVSKKPAGSGVEYYNGGTIYHSDSKSGYRVLFPGEKRVDKLFKWRDYSSKSARLAFEKKKVKERA